MTQAKRGSKRTSTVEGMGRLLYRPHTAIVSVLPISEQAFSAEARGCAGGFQLQDSNG